MSKIKKISIYALLVSMIVPFMMSFQSVEVSAVGRRTMNVEKEGQLTIHKFLNPDITPIENGGSGFEGDGTLGKPIDQGQPGVNGDTVPLPGVEFSVFGRLTTEELGELLAVGQEYDPKDPKPLDPKKVADFIKDKKPAFVGTTDNEGKVTYSKIAINTVDLANNVYLVVETKLPTVDKDNKPIVQQPSMPVLVNVPSINPEQATEQKDVNNYIYDVQLYMKNFNSREPEIEKEIDKPSHSVGEEVKYTITIKDLAYDMHEFELLEVTDVLDERLDFFEHGHGLDLKGPKAAVTFEEKNGKVITTFTEGEDYTVTDPGKGNNGTIKWIFTEKGIKKLTNITVDDTKVIKIRFTALTNDKAIPNEPIPNQAELDYVNKWGWGTKPPKPKPEEPWGPEKPINPPKPSEVVNTLWGQRSFEKVDKQNNTIKLEGAEFMVRNKSTKPITAYNEEGKMVTHPAGTMLYAIIKNNKVTGWTTSNKLAYENDWTITSGPDGKFQIDGLAYTNEVIYRKQYIFAVMKITTINGTAIQYVDRYEYVNANRRTATTSKAEIEAEIDGILTANKGEANGNGAWKFYKESEADYKRLGSNKPEDLIDFLGAEVNDYELIEARAPEGYAPIEKNPQDIVDGTTEEDPYEHPFKFTVPGFDTAGLPDYDLVETEIEVPNAKIPRLPITGELDRLLLF